MSDVRLTPAQAAERLGISVKTVYELCPEEDPEIGHFRFGRRIVIPEDEVAAYEERSFVAARPSADVIQLRHSRAA